jgi:predicted porin
MKKSLIALAVLAASGTAFAQSTVTMFGIVDAAVQVANGTAADRTAIVNSGYNSSRFGVRGVEDLGGGLKASFHLEGALSNDDGNAAGFNFQRRSLVSLSGGFGQIDLGREYTPHFWNQTVYDPFGTNGAGTSAALNTVSGGGTTVRTNNAINYYTPTMGGFKLQAQIAQGEALSSAAAPDAGNMTSFRASYDMGKLSAAVASGKTNVSAGVDITSTNYGAAYDFGVAKVMGSIFKDEKTGAADTDGYVFGLLAPVGPGTVRFAMSQSETGAAQVKKTAIGYVYGLSKRTDLYTTYASSKYSGGASDTFNGATNPALAGVNGSLKVFEAGVKHSF